MRDEVGQALEHGEGQRYQGGPIAYTPGVVWEAIFFLLILKIPIIYLAGVVWYAIRAEPRPQEGAAVTATLPDDEPAPWSWPRRLLSRRRPRGGPHGRPERGYSRSAAASRARAGVPK
jgi:hypothetical protein